MIVFYFREFSFGGTPPGDVVCSFNGTQQELNSYLGRPPPLTVAVFDESTSPPTLVYRAKGVRFTFQDVCKWRPDFPRLFIDKDDGSIWESEQLDGWGKVGKSPVMPGPGYVPPNAPKRYGTGVIPILYKRCKEPLDLDKL